MPGYGPATVGAYAAFETLLEKNRSHPECLRCHVTGFGAASGFTSLEGTPDLAGVTCDACSTFPGELDFAAMVEEANREIER